MPVPLFTHASTSCASSNQVAPTLQDRGNGPGVALLEAAIAETEAIDDDDRLRARGVFAAVGPHATDTVSEALWHRCRDLAVKRNIPVRWRPPTSPHIAGARPPTYEARTLLWILPR